MAKYSQHHSSSPSATLCIYSIFIALFLTVGVIEWLPYYPLGKITCLILFGVALFLGAIHTYFWLFLIPALLPIIDLTPWTGQIYITEFDLMLAGLITGQALRINIETKQNIILKSYRLHAPGLIIFCLLTVAILIATWHGLMPWPIWDENVFAGYHSHLNALRVSKGFWWALITYPLLHYAFNRNEIDHSRALRYFLYGLLCGVFLVACAGLWERVAYSSLLDFTNDYRITALFWEMHVGGAALDGFLALAVPFILWWATQIKSKRFLFFPFALFGFVAYIALVTFSRGVYAAFLLQLILFAILWQRQRPPQLHTFASLRLLPAFILFTLAVGAMVFTFYAGGYRALLGFLGLITLTFFAIPYLTRLSLIRLSGAIILAAGFAPFYLMLSSNFHKGVYLGYGLLWLMTFIILLSLWRYSRPTGSIRIWQFFFITFHTLTAIAVIQIALSWSITPAKHAIWLPVITVLLLTWLAARKTIPPWQLSRSSLFFTGIIGTVLTLLTIILAHSYMDTRFSSSSKDLEHRSEHWRVSLGLLESMPDWIFGLGAGRYPESYFWHAPHAKFPGTFLFKHERKNDSGNIYLSLGGPRHLLGFGELFRIGQMLAPNTSTPLIIHLKARAPQDVTLHLEICHRHLIYPMDCVLEKERIHASDEWKPYLIKLDKPNNPFGPSDELIPKLTMLSIALENNGRIVDIDDIQAFDSAHNLLITNGDFSAGINRWFFTSDRNHLPWHAKNMWLHTLIEQGLFGMLALTLLLIACLWRLTRGSRSRHPLAPALTTALLGFAVVGLFDSLLDVPRLAYLFYLLCWITLTLRKPRHRVANGVMPEHSEAIPLHTESVQHT